MSLISNKEEVKRKICIILFALLVVIDVIRNVGNDWQMTLASQVIGTIVGGLIILHYGIKSFLKWYNLFWLALCVILVWSMRFWFFDELIKVYYLYETYLAIFNMCMFGMIIMKIISVYFKDKHSGNNVNIKKKVSLKKCLLFAWLLYMILAVVAKDNTYRPEFYLIYFGVFYFVGYQKEELVRLLEDLCNGILIGFWGIQILAFAFRPFVDSHLRYSGMYYNSNIYDLICLIVLMILLIKATHIRRTKSIKNWKYWFWIFQYGVVFSFIILSVGRLSIALAVVLTSMYGIYILFLCDKVKVKKVVTMGSIYVLTICLTLPLAYFCVAYIPRVLKKPLSFVDEYRKWGDLNSEDNYVSFEEVVQESLGRFATLIFDYQEVNARREEENAQVINNGLLDPDWETKIYYLDAENYNSINLRVAIWRTYLDNVRWSGHVIDEWMLWISPYERSWHAHNLFIMQLYVYGIAAGGAFVVWTFLYGLCMWKYQKENINTIYTIFPFLMYILFIGFGMFELNHMYGQISWNLMFILQKCILDNEYKIDS